MSVPPAQRNTLPPPLKRRRRTATTVLAGDFDPRPLRDVLTSLLNGVGPYKLVEKDEETRRIVKREKREREKERRRAMLAARKEMGVAGPSNKASVASSASGRSTPTRGTPTVNSSTSSFWRARGPVVTMTRSVSPTPPPELSSSQPPTPGPSISSSTSQTSSKRPRTPDDGDAIDDQLSSPPPQPVLVKVPRKRVAAKKGWKGWVEGSPPPSDKLINLDAVPIMQERKLRSGKQFDAISVGQEGWI